MTNAKFRVIFLAFVDVARAVTPSQFVTGGWNSSLTKVIDNAVVGFVTLEQTGAANKPHHNGHSAEDRNESWS